MNFVVSKIDNVFSEFRKAFPKLDPDLIREVEFFQAPVIVECDYSNQMDKIPSHLEDELLEASARLDAARNKFLSNLEYKSELDHWDNLDDVDEFDEI